MENTDLRPQSISQLIANFVSMSEGCFIVFRLSQRRDHVASTVQRRFPSHTEKLELEYQKTLCENWNRSSIWKGKNVHLVIEVELNFSLGTDEFEADERYLSFTTTRNEIGQN